MKKRIGRYAGVTAVSMMAMFSAAAETLTYDGNNRLTSAVLAGEDLTIPEDVTIAAGAKLSGFGSLTFTGAVATEGVLELSADQSKAALTGPAELLGTEFSTVVANVDIDTLVPAFLTMGGASANGNGEPYNISRGPGWLEVQYHNKPYDAIKIVKARFEQRGADVVGKVLWAGCSYAFRKGSDFDLLPYESKTVATPEYPKRDYGIKSVQFVRQATLSIAFKGVTALGGVVSNATAGVRVTVADSERNQDSLVQDGIGAFYISGRSQVRLLNPNFFTFQNSLAGSFGSIAVETDDSADNPCTNFVQDVLKETTWTTVATNASLSAVTNVKAFLWGEPFGKSAQKGTIFHFSNDGRRLTCQFQHSTHRTWSGHNDYLIKGVQLELMQQGSDIVGRTPAARHYYSETGASNPIGLDLMQPNCLTNLVAIDTNKAGYCLLNTTLMFDRPLSSTADVFVNNDVTRGTMTVKGTASSPASLRIKTSRGFPNYGEADVFANADMILNVDVTSETSGPVYGGGECNLRVHPGGVLKQYGRNSFGTKVFVDVDGGELVLGYGRSDDENCQAYLPQLSLRNGARVTGLPPYVGKLLSNGVWKVGGTSPSVCSNGIILVGTDDAAAFASKWVLDVSDTGADGVADFMLCGDVTQHNPESNHRIEVEKCGNGVVGHDGDWNASVLRVIKDGAWRFVSNSGNENADISLEGGNLEFADGTKTQLGTLTVSASATLTLEAGAQVAFADSALETWNLADGEMIDIIGEIGPKSLRFGTSRTLGLAKVRKFRLNGTEKMHQDQDGYLVPGPQGLAIIVK